MRDRRAAIEIVDTPDTRTLTLELVEENLRELEDYLGAIEAMVSISKRKAEGTRSMLVELREDPS